MKTILKKEFLILLGIIILCSSYLYYGYMNNKAKERLIFYEQIEKQKKQERLDMCNQGVWNAYKADWNNACALVGKEDDCSLPGYTARNLDNSRQISLENCIQYNK